MVKLSINNKQWKKYITYVWFSITIKKLYNQSFNRYLELENYVKTSCFVKGENYE